MSDDLDAGMIIVRPAMLKGAAGWEAWEDEQVKPFFARRRHAIGYAISRGTDGRRRLEVRDAAGKVVRALDGLDLRALVLRREAEATDDAPPLAK